MKNDSWAIAKMPYPAEATLYQCNRDIIYNRGIKKRIGPDQEIVTQIRQYSKSKYCNCGFKVNIEPIKKEKHVEVHSIILNGCKQFYWSYWRGGGKKRVILLITSTPLNQIGCWKWENKYI